MEAVRTDLVVEMEAVTVEPLAVRRQEIVQRAERLNDRWRNREDVDGEPTRAQRASVVATAPPAAPSALLENVP
ncbi:hypothetical protein Sjap_018228 [Stephania japonica]|uniref:Uncharacterized protein n=1 Tax=Stephania japonica TaxID=461633 RepID=A0AAP0NKB1_9MAGN